MSPLLFILDLEHILRMFDSSHNKGVTLGSTRIHTLGYADELDLTEAGDVTGITTATVRTSNIVEGSRVKVDMEVKISKTNVLHVRAQDPVSDITDEEAAKTCKFV